MQFLTEHDDFLFHQAADVSRLAVLRARTGKCLYCLVLKDRHLFFSVGVIRRNTSHGYLPWLKRNVLGATFHNPAVPSAAIRRSLYRSLYILHFCFYRKHQDTKHILAV